MQALGFLTVTEGLVVRQQGRQVVVYHIRQQGAVGGDGRASPTAQKSWEKE
jgi:hypothetical protein